MSTASEPKLSEAARHLIIPAGIVTTEWPSVRDTCSTMGISFDLWQDGAGRVMLGKNAEGVYAADAIVLSIPRQVGKTFLIGAITFALCVKRPKTLALWTAHRYVTAEDTFNDMKTLADSPSVAPHVKKITTAAGQQAIWFHNGSKIMFGARERGFGRGFKRVAIIIFDEAQILTENAIDDMVPAANRHPNPLIMYAGTPPKPSDPSEVFTALREDALKSQADSTLFIEMSADQGADMDDREQWAKANPSFPHHTPVRSMLRMRRNMTPDSFAREALGIWGVAATVGAFPVGVWERLKVDEPTMQPPAGLGVACDLDATWLSLGAASAGEVKHVGPRIRSHVNDTATFVKVVKAAQDRYGCPVGVDKRGPASFLIPRLQEEGVEVTALSTDDFVQASADMRTAVADGTVEHAGYKELNKAVAAAGWRRIGERRVFARKTGDIAMLEAVSIALWVANFGDAPYDIEDSLL